MIKWIAWIFIVCASLSPCHAESDYFQIQEYCGGWAWSELSDLYRAQKYYANSREAGDQWYENDWLPYDETDRSTAPSAGRWTGRRWRRRPVKNASRMCSRKSIWRRATRMRIRLNPAILSKGSGRIRRRSVRHRGGRERRDMASQAGRRSGVRPRLFHSRALSWL